jgi:hypothetical protein
MALCRQKSRDDLSGRPSLRNAWVLAMQAAHSTPCNSSVFSFIFRPRRGRRIVMKFGGTSVADIERIRNVARHVKREVEAGNQVAVVVSAMSGKTNELVGWCRRPKAEGANFDQPANMTPSSPRASRSRPACSHRAAGYGHECPLLAGLAGSDPTDDAWRGAHRSDIDGVRC